MLLKSFIKYRNIALFRGNYLGNKGEIKGGFRLIYRGNIYTFSALYNILQIMSIKLVVIAALLK